MSLRLRRLILFLLLLVTVVASFWPTDNAVDNQVVAVADKHPLPQTTTSAALSAQPEPATRRNVSEQVAGGSPVDTSWSVSDQDPFGVRDWNPPPPPPPQPPPAPVALPAVALPPPAPVAPKLPYRFMGRMREESGKEVIYLAKGNDSFAVSVGDEIEKDFKLTKVNDRELTIEYLPMAYAYALSLDAPTQ